MAKEIPDYYTVINLPPARCEEEIENCGGLGTDLQKFCCDDKITGKKVTQRWQVSKDIVQIQETNTSSGELTTLVARGWRKKDRYHRGSKALEQILFEKDTGVIVRVPAAHGDANLFIKVSQQIVL